MKDTHIPEREARDAFWDHVEKGTTVMLGINTPNNHLQPMTTFPEQENGLIWFFTRNDTDFVRELVRQPECKLVLLSDDHEVQADVRGSCELQHDPRRIDEFWNPMVAAWYPEGKSDPHLTLVKFRPAEGQIWVSKKGAIRLAFEVVKANVTKREPDAGGVTNVTF